MQTPFITDLRAVALAQSESNPTTAAVSIRFYDHTGVHVGTAVTSAVDLAQQARAMLAFAEATALHAAGADGAAKPPHHHFPIMRDVRVSETA
ncbi:hypothetical protein [Sphingomonas hankookensis]|uniref:hypothetical protein n=1 Tax=Sphingomonas hankookensis TaxID=563996 RepID=UPI003D302C4A